MNRAVWDRDPYFRGHRNSAVPARLCEKTHVRPLPNSETLFLPALTGSPSVPGATSRRSEGKVAGHAVQMTRGERSRTAEESCLTERAIAGDGAAFATLYGRYERRVYNLCLRILGSADDAADATQEAFLSIFGRLPKLAGRDLQFGSYVFTSARNASYDIINRRRAARPTDEIPDSASPVGPGAGGDGESDPGAPERDPERNVLLAAQQEEIRAANDSLPERQREVLALFELEGMSYDEIAAVMEMNRNSVAQLISRARINLRDALRSTALASVAGSTPDCERALPLIALGDDGQPTTRANARWLRAHLATCDTCSLSREAMAEAGVSYRAWAPVAAVPWLFRDTVAKAAELTGSDWSEISESGRPEEEPATAPRAKPRTNATGVRRLLTGRGAGWRRRDPWLAGGLAAILLVALFTEATHDFAPSANEATIGPEAGQTIPVGDPSPAARKRSQPPRAGTAAQRRQSPGGGAQAGGATANPSSAAGASAKKPSKASSGGDASSVTPPPAAVPPPVTDPPPPPRRCFNAAGRPIPCP